jgi:hypothetical protein
MSILQLLNETLDWPIWLVLDDEEGESVLRIRDRCASGSVHSELILKVNRLRMASSSSLSSLWPLVSAQP